MAGPHPPTVERPPTVDELRRHSIELGLDAFGVTDATPLETARSIIHDRKDRGLHAGMSFTYGKPDRSTDPQRLLPGAQSIIVTALGYHRDHGADADVEHSARGAISRYVTEPFYEQLGAALEALAQPIRAAGHEALVVYDDNRLVDRAVAHRAGLGWFGKNTLLLLHGSPTVEVGVGTGSPTLLDQPLGSWFVLGSIVTTAQLTPTPADAATTTDDGCGPCVRCQTACPTGALDTAGELDARRCLAWLVQADGVFPPEFRAPLGNRLYGCDECQEVCPPNVRMTRRRPSSPPDPTATTAVDVIEMLSSSDDVLMGRFGHWYVPRRRPEYLRRNALVVLANTADPTDPAVSAAVAGSLESDRAVVVAHAVWAARRLGLHSLLARVSPQMRTDDMVGAELERSVEVRAGVGTSGR